MSKTIEFIEKNINSIKELLGSNDTSWYNTLKMFQQIKEELEAWEVVKPNIVEEDNIIDRDIKVIKIKCQLYPKGESNGKYEKLKKALEIEND